MNSKQRLLSLLTEKHFHPVIQFPPDQPLICLDLSAKNSMLQNRNLADTRTFDHLIFQEILNNNIGVGGFLEDRVIYRRSVHYQGEEPRSVHLGLDIWIAAGTPVFCPLKGIIHSFQDNEGFGNYGPTLILEHQIKDIPFYTLYGHLSRSSLGRLTPGKVFQPGDVMAEVGPYPENGDWPPHLHFQVMTSMEGNSGDFPGVAAPSQLARYMEICINPNVMLQLP